MRLERVALVEGGPDALAGFHFALSGGGENETGIVSMLGAGCRIPQECLPFFTDLPVRVFVHDDEPGLKAARRWAGQLAGAGARVSVGERVNLYMAAKKWDMAAAVASHLVKVDPQTAGWWISPAHAVRRTESIEKAEAILLRAQAIHPKVAVIAFNLACYASVTGRMEEAKERLRHADRT